MPAGFDFRPESHAARLAGFLDALGLAEVVLVGHDWGGPTMLGAAMAHASDDNHFMTAKVKLRHGAHSKTLELREGRPQIWRGYLVGVSSAQYAWGKKTFTFGVERAHR